MTPREKELLEAARTAKRVLAIASGQLTQYHKAVLNNIVWGDSALRQLDRALAAYEPPPVTSDPGFDGRDGGRHHPISSGAE